MRHKKWKFGSLVAFIIVVFLAGVALFGIAMKQSIGFVGEGGRSGGGGASAQW
jgi:hypothetical protein